MFQRFAWKWLKLLLTDYINSLFQLFFPLWFNRDKVMEREIHYVALDPPHFDHKHQKFCDHVMVDDDDNIITKQKPHHWTTWKWMQI